MTVEPRHRRWVVGVLLAFLLMLFLGCLEAWFAPAARDGLYFQRWSTENMMQTVSIRDLVDQPLTTLWNIHIQPPFLDTIRAVLAWARKSETQTDRQLLRRVDASLYILWIILYGLAGLVMYLWISEMTNIWFGVLATIVFFLHPACLFYATFLETTFLSATVVLALYYLLWRLKEKRYVPLPLLVTAYLFLFFTRSLFQWPFIAVLALSLILMKVPIRKVLVFAALAGLVAGVYTAKQAYRFGLAGTSSFAGYNLLSSIGYKVSYGEYARYFPLKADDPEAHRARVLTRFEKIDGTVNYNNENFLDVNNRLLQEYTALLRSTSLSRLLEAYRTNLKIYLLPSSRYTPHVIADHLPWRYPYDLILSFPILPVLLVAATAVWIRTSNRSDYLTNLGFCLPLGSVVLLSVICERGENMRFKFFIEPVLFVFLAVQVRTGIALLRSRFCAGPIVVSEG